MLFTNDFMVWLGNMGIQKIYLGTNLIYKRESSWFTLQLDTKSI